MANNSGSGQKKQLTEPRVLKGFRDLLPAEALVKQEMLAKLRRVFESFGYLPIETPHLEYTDVLMPQASEEISKQLFRFKDQGDRDVCLRFDLTVPFARFIAQHKNELGLPFKRYASGNVFRGERPSFGRYREFTQCDFDFVGANSPLADCETIAMVAQALEALGLNNFSININNRQIMNALALSLGFADSIAEVLRIIDKLSKIGETEVRQELATTCKLSSQACDQLFQLITISQKFSGTEVFKQAQSLATENKDFIKALQDFERLYLLMEAIPNLAEKIKIDFSIARGLGYYTGLVFETVLTDLPEVGSVCSGGRYDNLVSNYTNQEITGVGGSVGLDRLISALVELKQVDLNKSVADLLLVLFDETLRSAVYKMAAELRKNNLNVEVYPDAVKLGKQLQYAQRRNIRWVVLAGEDEIKNASYTLKDLRTGEQETISDLKSLLTRLKDECQNPT